MYRLRHMDVDDKICEQVDVALLAQVYPKAEIERCVRQSQPWASKARRVRQRTLLALVWFVMGMALWSRLNQRLVWQKLVGKRSSLHPGPAESALTASTLSARRKELGSECLQALMQARCQPIAQPQQMLKSPSLGATGSWPLTEPCSTPLIPMPMSRPLVAAAINMAKGPIRRCAVCS